MRRRAALLAGLAATAPGSLPWAGARAQQAVTCVVKFQDELVGVYVDGVQVATTATETAGELSFAFVDGSAEGHQVLAFAGRKTGVQESSHDFCSDSAASLSCTAAGSAWDGLATAAAAEGEPFLAYSSTEERPDGTEWTTLAFDDSSWSPPRQGDATFTCTGCGAGDAVWASECLRNVYFRVVVCSDSDGDGLCDYVDNCPTTSNVRQQDVDLDGIGNACDACPVDAENDADTDSVCGDVDNCPYVSNAGQADTDSDGIGDDCDTCPSDFDNDVDGDRVCGDVDNCPTLSNARQADGDGDGVGNVCDPCNFDLENDIDGDQLCADVDNCPNFANFRQADADSDGLGDGCDVCPSDPENDPDVDGICSDVDNCPRGDNVNQNDVDLDGIGDVCDACAFDAENDADADGICGDVDNCPDYANFRQADADSDGLGDGCDGCPADAANDADGDGVCGDVDNCPVDANRNQLDTDTDGAGDECDACALDAENDADADGICGNVDNCPVDANRNQLDTDSDGAGDECDACALDAENDADGDMVCGDVDNCPDIANVDQADGDNDGTGDACSTTQHHYSQCFTDSSDVGNWQATSIVVFRSSYEQSALKIRGWGYVERTLATAIELSSFSSVTALAQVRGSDLGASGLCKLELSVDNFATGVSVVQVDSSSIAARRLSSAGDEAAHMRQVPPYVRGAARERAHMPKDIHSMAGALAPGRLHGGGAMRQLQALFNPDICSTAHVPGDPQITGAVTVPASAWATGAVLKARFASFAFGADAACSLEELHLTGQV